MKPASDRRILLISNSTLHGSGYLDHAEAEIRSFLGHVNRILFIPFALNDHDSYAAKARNRFSAMGYEFESIHEAQDPLEAVEAMEAIFIGGGNTFRLLKALYAFDLLSAIRRRIEHGVPYVGSSAGANVAGPTIKTTNDMPIVEPPSFNALGLVPFQINPHYLDPDPDSTHMGETREQRIKEFHEENETPVVGLREGSWIQVEDGHATLGGSRGARIFRRGREPEERRTGESLDDLMQAFPHPQI